MGIYNWKDLQKSNNEIAYFKNMNKQANKNKIINDKSKDHSVSENEYSDPDKNGDLDNIFFLKNIKQLNVKL